VGGAHLPRDVKDRRSLEKFGEVEILKKCESWKEKESERESWNFWMFEACASALILYKFLVLS